MAKTDTHHSHSGAHHPAGHDHAGHKPSHQPAGALDRRTILFGAGAAVVVLGGIAAWRLWPASEAVPVAGPQDDVSMAALMAPQPLPDMVLGNAKAPVTIVEYASMTCPHCAHFQETTFPELKKRYIDTGKVRYIAREFPLDQLALAAFALARCSADNDSNKYFALIDTLYRQQRTWAVERPIEPLFGIVKQVGFTQESFNACLANQQLLASIESERQRAIDQFKVESTPTFFVNGKRVPGAVSIEDFAKVIDPQVTGS